MDPNEIQWNWPTAIRVFSSVSSRVSHQGLKAFSASVLSNNDFRTSPSKAMEAIISANTKHDFPKTKLNTQNKCLFFFVLLPLLKLCLQLTYMSTDSPMPLSPYSGGLSLLCPNYGDDFDGEMLAIVCTFYRKTRKHGFLKLNSTFS